MVKAEWGTKRMCQSCGARFYDFNKSPIVCPACGATFEPEAVQKSRRSRPAPKAAAAAPVVPAAAAVEDEELEAVVDENEAEDAAYEDADELDEGAGVDVVPPDDDENN